MSIFDLFNKSKTDRIASRHLGKKSEEATTYDSFLLVAVPRLENRKQYNIDDNNLPFEGWDVWHAYEFSCLTETGVPVTRVLKLKYSSVSKYIVESKSLKLYLNSFNMFKIGLDVNECLELCKNLITEDLQQCLREPVEAEFLDDSTKRVEIFNNFENIMNFVNEKNLSTEVYKEDPELLKVCFSTEKTSKYLKFDSLRSNCRVTHQPDFGDAFIYYNSKKHIDESSLIKYLVSFRTEYHFHEECCEMIYKRLYDLLDENDELFVCALYTRRGGIDISPVRWSKGLQINDVNHLLDLTTLARAGNKQ